MQEIETDFITTIVSDTDDDTHDSQEDYALLGYDPVSNVIRLTLNTDGKEKFAQYNFDAGAFIEELGRAIKVTTNQMLDEREAEANN